MTPLYPYSYSSVDPYSYSSVEFLFWGHSDLMDFLPWIERHWLRCVSAPMSVWMIKVVFIYSTKIWRNLTTTMICCSIYIINLSVLAFYGIIHAYEINYRVQCWRTGEGSQDQGLFRGSRSRSKKKNLEGAGAVKTLKPGARPF